MGDAAIVDVRTSTAVNPNDTTENTERDLLFHGEGSGDL